jgi:tetratricopeptide (TPR) repeat protein
MTSSARRSVRVSPTWAALSFALSLSLTLALTCLCLPTAAAQSVQVSLQSDDGVYVGEPFRLSIVVSDFDESPEPTISPLTLDGCPDCSVRFLGMTPQVRSMIQIINGRRSEFREVSFMYQYEVIAPRAGTYTLPALVATQGMKSASSRAATLQVQEVESTDEMMIRLDVPQRPLWIGERFEATLDWYVSMEVLKQYQQRDVFSGQIQQQLPTHGFDVPAWRAAGLDVRLPKGVSPPGRGQMRFTFQTQSGELVLPAAYEEVQEGGQAWGRLRFKVEVTPLRAGVMTWEGARVTAQLPVRQGRRMVGVRKKALDKERQLEVKPMPGSAPASFRNAIGSGFSLEAALDRSVVKVGDPIELQLTVRGDADLTGLILPPLDGSGGLSADLFSLSGASPAGELVEEPGKPPARRFRVPLRIRSAAVKEIPPLPFSFFDPATGSYRTVHSEPLALSVRDSAVVSAQDVVVSPNSAGSAAPSAGNNGSNGAGAQGAAPQVGADSVVVAGGAGVSLVGVDLGLSDPKGALATAWRLGGVWPWLVGLYGLPLALFGWVSYWGRTASSRGAKGERGAAKARLSKALDKAKAAPAVEVIAEVVGALHGLAAALARPLTAEDRALMGELETAAYDPAAARAPLPEALREQVRARVAGWEAGDAGRGAGRGGAAALWLIAALAGWGAGQAREAYGVTPQEARAAYQQALEEPERGARLQAFARAQSMFSALISEHPDAPGLLTDLGHAALGAQDLGDAVLAYRRALALDPTEGRALKNLAFIREQALPAWAVRPQAPSAVETFLFWHQRMTPAACLLWGAVAFCCAVLLWVPWPRAGARALRPLAVAPALLWVWLTAAGVAAPTPDRDAVVMVDDLPLRVADSASAAQVSERRLPAGAEVTLLERRDGWAKVQAPSGQEGWVPVASVALVIAEAPARGAAK